MRTSDFYYELPPELIARYPAEPRGASRLLYLDGARGEHRDMQFADMPTLLKAGDLLVFNDTRVIPARLFGVKQTGGRIEVLIERVLDRHKALAQIRASKPPKPGQRLDLEGGVTARVLGRTGEFYEIDFGPEHTALEQLERAGHMPLPPYIDRADEPVDRTRYQTVYARVPGAVAAPTAGLHFDESMLARLKQMGVEFGWLTLHVGAGTFQPVRTENIAEHRMHTEYLKLPPALCDQVNAARAAGRRVVAVGTTVVRALETAAQGCANAASRSDPQGCGEVEQRRDDCKDAGGRAASGTAAEQLPGRAGAAPAAADGRVAPFEGETDIFIHPGYRFRVVDALLTNFHLPGSTLLMLVCAFGGAAAVLAAYRHAAAARYRFYSYGDAMFVLPASVGRGRTPG